MTTVLSEPTQNLIIQKQGPGRLYYRLGLNYAPNDLNLKPANYGFKVHVDVMPCSLCYDM